MFVGIIYLVILKIICIDVASPGIHAHASHVSFILVSLRMRPMFHVFRSNVSQFSLFFQGCVSNKVGSVDSLPWGDYR